MASFASYNHVLRMYIRNLICVTYGGHLLMATRPLGYARLMQRCPAHSFSADPILENDFSEPGARGEGQ